MDAQLQPLSPESIPLVQHECANSVFWELSPEAQANKNIDAAFEKEAWLATGILDGVCQGFNLNYTNQRTDIPPLRAIATIVACDPAFAPGAVQLPTAPVSDDAWLLTSLHINPVVAGTGLETVLLDAVIMAAVAAEVSALEAFGYYIDFVEDPDVPLAPELCDILSQTQAIGLVAADVLQSAGFTVVQDHLVLPKLRLELPPARELLTAQAAEELLNSIVV